MKKTNKTNGTSANSIFAQAQTPNPKTKKTRHVLSVWVEKADKDSEKANKASLFEAMLEEQRGLNANCKLFAKYANDNRMLSVIRLAGIKARFEDFSIIFTPDFITDNLVQGFGGYRYNSKNQICRVTLPKNPEKVQEFEMLAHEKTEPNAKGVCGFLVPINRYTFAQFVRLVKVAVENYRKAE